MKKTIKALLCTGMIFSANAMASDVYYLYDSVKTETVNPAPQFQHGMNKSEVSLSWSDADFGDGAKLSFDYEILPNITFLLDYSTFNADEIKPDVDIDTLGFGLGFHHNISKHSDVAQTDIFIEGTINSVDVRDGADKEDYDYGEVKLGFMSTAWYPNTQIEAGYIYTRYDSVNNITIDKSNDDGVFFDLTYKLDSNFGLNFTTEFKGQQTYFDFGIKYFL